MIQLDRVKRNMTASNLAAEIASSVTIKQTLENALREAYEKGFKDGQCTPDNRNINEIHEKVKEAVFTWMNNNGTYDKWLFRDIDNCFDSEYT